MRRRVRDLVARRSVQRWAAEVVGYGLAAVGAWMVWAPLGLFVAAGYIIVVANMGGDDHAGN